MKITHLLSLLSLTSFSAVAQQTCYVDMIDAGNRIVGTYTGFDDPNVCQEGMKACRKAIRFEAHLGGVDCIRESGRVNPVPVPVPVPAPRPVPPVVIPAPAPVPAPPVVIPAPRPIPAPGCQHPNQCGQVYSRMQALQALIAVESSVQDAEGNLNLVESASQHHGISLYEATVNFNRVLALEGGSAKTNEARNTFRILLGKLDPHQDLSLTRLVDALQALIRVESSAADARVNLDYVLAAVARGYGLEETVHLFNEVLRLSGGSAKTNEARVTFNRLTQSSSQINLHELKDALSQLAQVENSIQDALGNLEHAMMLLQQGYSLGEAASAFNEVLRLSGGSAKTNEARQVYKTLVSYLQLVHLQDLMQGLRSLSAAENTVQDALGNLDLVVRAASVCGSVQNAAMEFNRVLTQVGGSSKTNEARSLFRRIYGI